MHDVLKRLNIENFRNYSEKNAHLEKGINIVVGKNGQGKTNLLEALFFLIKQKSMRTNDAQEMIKSGEERALVEGILDIGRETRIVRSIEKGGRVEGNKIPQDIEVVCFQPDDVWMVKGGPEARRRYLDEIILGLKKGYQETLREYQRVIRQRNEAIREVRRGLKGREYIRSWNPMLVRTGSCIVEERMDTARRIGAEMTKVAERWGMAGVGLRYYATMGEGPVDAERIRKKIERVEEAEIRRGATLLGPHRDELLFTLGERNVRRECSQGEQKLLIIMWRLAQGRLLIDVAGKEVLMLMDDCLSELDDGNRKRVMRETKGWRQVVVTSTDDLDEFTGLAKISL